MNTPQLWRRIVFTAYMLGAAAIFVWFDSLVIVALLLAMFGFYQASTADERRQYEDFNRKLPFYRRVEFVVVLFVFMFMCVINLTPMGDPDSEAGTLLIRILTWLSAGSMIWFTISHWWRWLYRVKQESTGAHPNVGTNCDDMNPTFIWRLGLATALMLVGAVLFLLNNFYFVAAILFVCIGIRLVTPGSSWRREKLGWTEPLRTWKLVAGIILALVFGFAMLPTSGTESSLEELMGNWIPIVCAIGVGLMVVQEWRDYFVLRRTERN